MTTSLDRISFLLSRRPFVVLGYSAADSVWCPTCLRTAAGLSPDRPDYDGKPILPLFAREPTVRDEMCDGCGEQLMELLAERAPEAPALPRSTVREPGGARGPAVRWSCTYEMGMMSLP
jgi:hypothetical protein